MPYYRIVIWTKKRAKPFIGIREIEDSQINTVFISLKKKASDIYSSNLVDIEVQMLPKMSKAVQDFIRKKQKKG